jgi:hypothetical protein
MIGERYTGGLSTDEGADISADLEDAIPVDHALDAPSYVLDDISPRASGFVLVVVGGTCHVVGRDFGVAETDGGGSLGAHARHGDERASKLRGAVLERKRANGRVSHLPARRNLAHRVLDQLT